VSIEANETFSEKGFGFIFCARFIKELSEVEEALKGYEMVLAMELC
jgi:hypothetical protein